MRKVQNTGASSRRRKRVAGGCCAWGCGRTAAPDGCHPVPVVCHQDLAGLHAHDVCRNRHRLVRWYGTRRMPAPANELTSTCPGSHQCPMLLQAPKPLVGCREVLGPKTEGRASDRSWGDGEGPLARTAGRCRPPAPGAGPPLLSSPLQSLLGPIGATQAVGLRGGMRGEVAGVVTWAEKGSSATVLPAPVGRLLPWPWVGRYFCCLHPPCGELDVHEPQNPCGSPTSDWLANWATAPLGCAIMTASARPASPRPPAGT